MGRSVYEECPNCKARFPDYPDVESCLKALLPIEASGSVLFRGEACLFPSSSPGTVRVLRDEDLSFDEKTFLIDAVGMLQDWFEEHQPWALDDCDMFLQHYGLPTDLLDFTDSAKIATYFAFKDKREHIGRVAVLPLNSNTHTMLDVIPFSQFSVGGRILQRPIKQRGWAVRHQPGAPTDFADEDTCRQLNLSWYTFAKSCQDETLFADLKDILDSKGDPIADEMRSWLNEVSRNTWQSASVRNRMIERVSRFL